MSMPARAPIAKAASVQAANATPRRSNTIGPNGICQPSAKNGWKYQENSMLKAPAAAVTVTASGTSLASVQRHRPKPWVQAYRKVPVSSSRASTGAPTNAPISAGTTCSRAAIAVDDALLTLLSRVSQAGELAGRQAAAAA